MLSTLTAQEMSFDSMEGLTVMKRLPNTSICADSFPALTDVLNKIFITIPADRWSERREAICSVLTNLTLNPDEVSRYALFDKAYPYTRNLVTSDGFNYSLLILCWNPSMESKIHDHPCDGCFVKVLKGQVREVRYRPSPETNELITIKDTICSEGMVTYMDDFIGYHKVGNATSDVNAVTLHLYTPPYNRCKVWANEQLSSSFEGISSYYSEYGVPCYQGSLNHWYI